MAITCPGFHILLEYETLRFLIVVVVFVLTSTSVEDCAFLMALVILGPSNISPVDQAGSVTEILLYSYFLC